MTSEVFSSAADVSPEKQAPSFEALGLSLEVLEAVSDMGYAEPTPVQAAAIPEVLAGRDVLAAAQTGTGKTAAFLLPTMSDLGHVERSRGRSRSVGCGPLMLVVTPTRELAQQIEEVCHAIAKRTHHSSVTVVGGVSYNPQRNALKRGCDVLIATPGRLIDLMEQGACSLDQVQVLVLDEADRMLDMGFLPAIRTIVDATNKERQTLLFSATLDEKQVGSIFDLVHDPARVEIAPATSTADTVDQFVLPVSLEAKNALLASVLKKSGAKRVIVFARTKHRADACRRRLVRAGFSCGVIHGDRSQAQRERALRAFREGNCDVLVATDVLSRGIDIADVSYVINFDVPKDPVDYIHRIGRTGRGGDVGWSLTFVTEQDRDEFFDIEALMGKAVDLFDAEGLDCGEHPVEIDPDREPAARVPGKKAKKKRRRSKKAAVSSSVSEKPAAARSDRASVVEAADSASEDSRKGKGGSRKRSSVPHRKPTKKQDVAKKPAARPDALRPGVKSSGLRSGAKASDQGAARTKKGRSGSSSRQGAPKGSAVRRGSGKSKGAKASRR